MFRKFYPLRKDSHENLHCFTTTFFRFYGTGLLLQSLNNSADLPPQYIWNRESIMHKIKTLNIYVKTQTIKAFAKPIWNSFHKQ
jgi:hypothetical protein